MCNAWSFSGYFNILWLVAIEMSMSTIRYIIPYGKLDFSNVLFKIITKPIVYSICIFTLHFVHYGLNCRMTLFVWDINTTEHYNDVIMRNWRLKSGLFTQPFIQAQIKWNIKAPHHWPLWGEFIDDRWISRMNSPHKRPVTRVMFPFDDVIMTISTA